MCFSKLCFDSNFKHMVTGGEHQNCLPGFRTRARIWTNTLQKIPILSQMIISPFTCVSTVCNLTNTQFLTSMILRITGTVLSNIYV